MDGDGGASIDGRVLQALQSQEMDGERVVNGARVGLLVIDALDFALVWSSQAPAAARFYFTLGLLYAVYTAILLVLLRDRSRYFPRLKYITVFVDITFVYLMTAGSLLNYSGVYAVYRSPLMWLFLATFNALSGLRYCAHASLFSGLLTLGYGAIELAIMAQLPIAWSPKLSFIGVELNFANCAQTVVFATMPAWFAAIVAYRSRRLMIYAAKEAAERAALHELAEAKDRFLSIASHELRSPIAALCASVDLIALDPDALAETSTRDVIIDRMKARALRLMKLVEQLLDSTRLGRDVPLEPVPCDLSQICRSSAEGLGPDGQRLIIEGGGAIAGRWDPSRLEQVVTNLMSNALRYSPPDKPVIVRLASDHRRALLTVADEGIGIPAEQLGQVFSPFFRATNAHRTNRRGLGLGLFIAHDIVRRHGGDVRVRSTEGVGTTFTVELPLQPPA